MKKRLFLISTFSFFMLQAFETTAKNNSGLPPILDYYPNCKYESLKQLRVNSEVSSSDIADETERLLIKLRTKAHEQGADALILIDKKFHQKIASIRHVTGKPDTLYQIAYEAIFIKECEEKDKSNRKLARLSHEGNRTIVTSQTYKSSNTFTFTFPEKAKLNRPKLTDNNISLEHGVYGVKLGTDYENVVGKLGDPSVYFSLNDNELVISYGRRHWLYFQSGILVKVEFGSALLSESMINRVPFIDFFDDSLWKINNVISRKDSLADVKKALNVTGKLNNKNQLVINSNGKTLTLSFEYIKDHETLQKNYTLNRFSLSQNNYKDFTVNLDVKTLKQAGFLKDILVTDGETETLNIVKLKETLGEPFAKIILTPSSALNLYNSNLVIATEDTELESILLVENVFNTSLSKSTLNAVWTLGDYLQGETLEDTRLHIPSNAFELNGKIEIESESYSLSLEFDGDDDKSLLYSATLQFF